MSDLILQWVNNSVGLSRNVKVFEQDFASGYLFGELLSKHGLLKTFEEAFEDRSTADAKRKNFAQLKEALKNSGLGVTLRDEQARQIMNEDRGSSLRLLYQLRQVLVPQKGASNKREVTAIISKEPVGEDAERFHDTKLKVLAPSDPRKRFELHTKQFVDESSRQMQDAAEREATQNQRIAEQQADFRSSRREVLQFRKDDRERRDVKGKKQWGQNFERNTKTMEKQLLLEKQTIQKVQDRVDRVRDHHKMDCGYSQDEEGQGIGWFERNLERLGIDLMSEDVKQAAPPQATATTTKVEVTHLMTRIKKSKQTNDHARKERVVRQHRDHLMQEEQNQAHRALVDEEALLAKLLQESLDSRKEALAYDHLVRRKEAERAQREQRQQERGAVNLKRMEDATNRMAEKAGEERAALLATRRAEEERAQLRLAAGIPQLDDAAFEEAGEEEESESEDEEGDDMWNPEAYEDKHVKKQGTNPISPSAASRRYPEEGSPTPSSPCNKRGRSRGEAMLDESYVAPVQVLSKCVQDTLVSEYLFARGPWSGTPADPELDDESREQCRLGGLVRWLVTPEEPSPGGQVQLPLDYLPVVAFKSGPAGSMTATVAARVATRLCEDMNLALVEPSKVIAECVTLARKEEHPPSWPSLERFHQLGRTLLRLMEQAHGDASVIPPDVYAEILFRKIELLSAPPPKPVEEEQHVDPKAKKKPQKKEKKKVVEEEDHLRPEGILILDFPVDLEQNAAWESALRGYTSPLLRLLDGEEDELVRLSGTLAPWWREGVAPGVMADAREEVPVSALEQPADPPRGAGGAGAPPPMRLLSIRDADHEALCDSILAEFAIEAAAEAAAAEPPPKGKHHHHDPPPEPVEEPLPLYCKGSGQEIAHCKSPVDRAWLYQQAQTLTQAFVAPLGSGAELLAKQPDAAEEGAPPLEETLYTQVQDLLHSWREGMASYQKALAEEQRQSSCPSPDADAAAATAADCEAEAGDGEQKGETEVELAENGGEAAAAEGPASGEHAEGEAEDEAQEGPAARPGEGLPWASLGAEAREAQGLLWRRCLSQYLTTLQTALTELRENCSSYDEDIVKMQRQFLELLQRGDEKHHILEDFLKGWPDRHARLPAEELQLQLEELSDRLWQCTDRRRAETLQERGRLMMGAFWEEQAGNTLRAVEKLHAVEFRRLSRCATLLADAHGEKVPAALAASPPASALPHNISAEEISDWLQESVARHAGPDCMDGTGDEGTGPSEWLCAALRGEQRGHVQRLMAVATWASERLKTMQKQLMDVFSRMDDWIRDRVVTENDAIKATIAQIRTATSEATNLLGSAPPSPTESRRPSRRFSVASLAAHPMMKVMASPAGGALRKKRMDFLRALDAHTLDVEILRPPKTDMGMVVPASVPMHRGGGRPTSVPGHGQERLHDEWTLTMLSALLESFRQRSNLGVLPHQEVCTLLLQNRNATMTREVDLVPQLWVQRSEAALEVCCRTFIAPDWGNPHVDLTEFLLLLTFHGRRLAWPSLQALESSRTWLESEERGPGKPAGARYPDVPVSEEQFMQLPLWGEIGPGGKEEVRRWIFRLLHCFSPPQADGGPEPAAPRCISARRLFTYLALGQGPADGLSRAMRVLMPAPTLQEPVAEAAADGAGGEVHRPPPRMRVQDLWAVLFSVGGRPEGAVAPPPSLADFSKEILGPSRSPTPGPEPVGGHGGKHHGKADKKGAAAAKPAAAKAPKAKAAPKGSRNATPALHEEDDPQLHVPPEEATVALDGGSEALLRHSALVGALCSHGALHCRKQAFSGLLLEAGAAASPALTSAGQAATVQGLESLVPSAASGCGTQVASPEPN